MSGDASINEHEPEEFFDGPYLRVAQAIRSGDQSFLLSLMKGGPLTYQPIDPNYVGRQGMTLLLWAASLDNIKAVETLLKNGADPNQKIVNVKGDTIQLLAIAAKGKSDALFDVLLQNKADPNSRDRDEPALFSAIYADRFDRMHQLIDAGGDINITNGVNTPAVIVLARLRKYRYTLELLERGAILTNSVANDIIYLIQKYPLDPTVPNYESQIKVKKMLVDRGYTFPPPPKQ